MNFEYFIVPDKIAFCYVQCLIMTSANTVGLFSKDKGKYWTAKCMSMLPLACMGWVEGFMCDTFLIHVGGHAWYDFSIPFGITVYFLYIKSLEANAQESDSIKESGTKVADGKSLKVE